MCVEPQDKHKYVQHVRNRFRASENSGGFFFFLETRCFRPVFVDLDHNKLNLERYPRCPATFMAVAVSLYVSSKGHISGANPS